MLGITRRSVLLVSFTLALIAGVVWLVAFQLIPGPPKRITIAAGAKGGAFEYYAQRYRDILLRSHIRLDLRTTEGTAENLRLLQDRKSGVDAAFIQGGVSSSEQAPGIESLGRVSYLVFFVFFHEADALTDLADLRGRRIAVGPEGSGTRIVAEKVLRVNGVTAEDATFLSLSGEPAVEALRSGDADVLFLGNVLDSPAVQSLLHTPGIKLMSMAHAKALTRKFPFLYKLELPAGVVDLERNIPSSDITLIGTTYSVAVRQDIHPEIVELMARALVEVHSAPNVLQQFGEFPMATDPEFPVAEAAHDFYKDGPSFLQRYLPFWVASYLRRILAIAVAVIAIAVPVFSTLPKIYLWLLRRQIVGLYRDLRTLNDRIGPAADPSGAAANWSELQRIERAAAGLPQRNSDLFFELKIQIDATRARLAAQSPAAPSAVIQPGYEAVAG